MSRSDEGFLSRWSRRKAGLATPRAESTPPGAATPAAAPAPAGAAAAATGELPPAHETPSAVGTPAGATPTPALHGADAAPVPTLEDVATLTRTSDYSRFVQPGVGRDVSNAAMKKLFSDPHFNVMDGLDTYIDDYGKADPLPPSMLRLMNQAATLGLFDEEPADPDGANAAVPSAVTTSPPGPTPLPVPAAASAPAQACPDGRATPVLAQSPPTPDLATPLASAPHPDDDADLRLQPDHAPGRRGPEPGPGH